MEAVQRLAVPEQQQLSDRAVLERVEHDPGTRERSRLRVL